MNLKEHAANIGKHGMLTTTEGFDIVVRIEDVKQAYGTYRYLVDHFHGSGKKWVLAERVREITKPSYGLDTRS